LQTLPNGSNNIFPALDEIPAHFRLAQAVELRACLINDKLRALQGETQEVFSPVLTRATQGLKRQRIGSFPLKTEAQALIVLAAAVDADDNGRGRLLVSIARSGH